MEVNLTFTGQPDHLRRAIETVERKLEGLEKAAAKAERLIETIDFDQARTMAVGAQTVETAFQQLTRAVEKLVIAKKSIPNQTAAMTGEAVAARTLAHEVDNLADQYEELRRAERSAVAGLWAGARSPGMTRGGIGSVMQRDPYTGRFLGTAYRYAIGGEDYRRFLAQISAGAGRQDYTDIWRRSAMPRGTLAALTSQKADITTTERRGFWRAFMGGLTGGGAGDAIGGGFMGGGGGRRGGGIFSTHTSYGLDPIGGFLAMGPGGRRATGEVLATAVAGISTVLAPLAPAVGVLAAIPQAAATAAAAMGVLKLAFNDVGKAIDGNKKAYEQLTPAQKAFVDLVRKDLYPLLNGLRDLAAESVMPGVTKGLQTFLDSDNWETLGGVIQGVGSALGDVAASWGEFLARSDIGDRFGRVFAESADQIGRWSKILQVAVEDILILAEGFRPLAQWLDRVTLKGVTWLRELLKGAEASGQMDRANRVVIRSLQLLGQFTMALLNVLEALYEVLNPLGQELLPYLSDKLDKLAGWMRKNADEIRGPMIGAAEALEAVLKLVWDVVERLYRALDKLKGMFEDITGVTIEWKDVFLGLFALNIATTIAGWTSAMWALFASEEAAAGMAATLRARLIALRRIGVIFLAIELVMNWSEYKAKAEGLAERFTKWFRGTKVGRLETWLESKSGPIGDYAAWKGEGETRGKAFGSAFFQSVSGAVTGLGAQLSSQIASELFAPGGALGQALASIGGPGSSVGGIPVNLLALANVSVGNPRGASTMGTPGQGTHAQSDWQSANAYDVRVSPGVPVISPVTGTIVKISHGYGSATPSGSKVLYGDSITIAYEGGQLFFTHLLPGSIPKHFKEGMFIFVGTQIGVAGSLGHVHVGGTAGGSKVPVPKATVTPTGGAPPFETPTASTGPTELAPLAMRIELAEAELTKRLDDDLEAINKIIKAIRKGLKGLTGEERLAGLQELKGYLDQRNSILQDLYGSLINVKTVQQLRDAMSKWRSGFTAEYLKEHPRLAAFIKNRMAEINKLLSGEVTPAEFKKALQKFKDLKDGVASIMDQIAEAIKARREKIGDAFSSVWEVIADIAMTKFRNKVQQQLDAFDRMVEAWFAEFDARVESYRTPAELAIEAIENAAELESLQRNLEDAQKRLADAQAGKSEDFESEVRSAREILGRYTLARKIERAQLGTMGGGTPTDLTDRLLRDMRQALMPKFTSSLEDIEAATRAVEDAQRELNLYFLRGQAKKEREEFDKEMEAQREAKQQQFEMERANLEAKLAKEQQVFEAKLAVTQARILAALLAGDPAALKEALGDLGTDFGFNAQEIRMVTTWLEKLNSIAGNQLDVLKHIANILAGQAGMAEPYPGAGSESGGGGGGGGSTRPPEGAPRTGTGGPTALGSVGSLSFKAMASGGVLVGERGPEAVIPLDNPRFNVGGVIVVPGRGGRGVAGVAAGTNVTVRFEGDAAAFEKFIRVKAVEASDQISDRMGRQADTRRRGGRF